MSLLKPGSSCSLQFCVSSGSRRPFLEAGNFRMASRFECWKRPGWLSVETMSTVEAALGSRCSRGRRRRHPAMLHRGSEEMVPASCGHTLLLRCCRGSSFLQRNKPWGWAQGRGHRQHFPSGGDAGGCDHQEFRVPFGTPVRRGGGGRLCHPLSVNAVTPFIVIWS